MNIEMNYYYYELNFESMKQEDDDVNIVLSYFFSRLILIQRYESFIFHSCQNPSWKVNYFHLEFTSNRSIRNDDSSKVCVSIREDNSGRFTSSTLRAVLQDPETCSLPVKEKLGPIGGSIPPRYVRLLEEKRGSRHAL